MLRTFPILQFPQLVAKFDDLVFRTLQDVLNVNLNDEKWLLAAGKDAMTVLASAMSRILLSQRLFHL